MTGSRLWQLLRWSLALGLTGLAVWLSVRQVRWDLLTEALAGAQLSLLALSLGTVLVTTGAKAVRWEVLLRNLDAQVRSRRILRVLLIGQMGNSFLPARAGDVGRVVLVGPQTPGGGAAVLGTLIVEKALDGVMGLLVLLGLALVAPLPDWLGGPVLALALLTGVLLAVLFIAAIRPQRFSRLLTSLARWLPALDSPNIRQVISDLNSGLGLLRSRRDTALALLASVVVWGLAVLTNVTAMAGLGIEGPAWSPWLVMVAGYVANFLPTVPGQVGVFEYAVVLSLTAADVGPAPALAVGLVLHLLIYGPPAVLGPISMALEGLSWGKFRSARVEGPASQPVVATASDAPQDAANLNRATDPAEAAAGDAYHVGSGLLASVVVPAYDAEDTLAACLEALADQSVAPDSYEVIVVDDGSSDGTAALAEQHSVIVIRQEHAWAAAARNRGARAARGQFLLFTDADCRPQRNWVEQMLAPFADPRVAGVKGVYHTRQHSTIAHFVQAEHEEKYDRLAQQTPIDFVDTHAAAYRRTVFLAVGGFDPSFRANEDQELSYRLARAGHRLVFAPQAVVDHRHATTISHYARRKIQLGRWKVRVHLRHPAKILGDSYTPWTQKIQLLLVPIIAGLALAAALGRAPWLVVGLLAAAGLLSTLPLVRKAASHGNRVALVAPFLALVRALALLAGMAWGIMSEAFGFLDRP
jgi:uncharacterized protein (TIRG00374 family)